MDQERELLIKELNKLGFDDTINCCVDVNDIATFILKDRERIVAPLVKAISLDRSTIKISYTVLLEAIDETFKLAGVK